MTIFIGTAIVTSNPPSVIIDSPTGGFGGIEAARISNYTGELLEMFNVTGDAPTSTQYLLPFQSNVFQMHNVRQPPIIVAAGLGTSFDTEAVLVEWSTDPRIDFPGTYPVGLTEAALLATGNKAYNVRVDVAAGAATLAYHGQAFALVPPTVTATELLLPVNDQRLDATIVNEGTTILRYSNLGGAAVGAYTRLFPGDGATFAGSSITLGNGSAIEIHGDYTNNGTSVSIFGDASF